MNKLRTLKITLSAFVLAMTSVSSYALSCVVTLVKDNCWLDYDVTIDIQDSRKKVSLSKALIPKGKNWNRVSFECEPTQVLSATAMFSPAIWEKDKDKVYNAVRFWTLPGLPPEKEALWSINICFPGQFESVPSPLQTQNCGCSLDGIPPVENTNLIN